MWGWGSTAQSLALTQGTAEIPRDPGAQSSQSLPWGWERHWGSSAPSAATASLPVTPARAAPSAPSCIPCSSSPCRPSPNSPAGIPQLLPPWGSLEAGSTPNPHCPPGHTIPHPKSCCSPWTAGQGSAGQAVGQPGVTAAPRAPGTAPASLGRAPTLPRPSQTQLGSQILRNLPQPPQQMGRAGIFQPIPEGSLLRDHPMARDHPERRVLATERGWESRRSTREGLFWEPRQSPGSCSPPNSHSWI